jgi:predicted component of type VI protein secretion system
MLAHYASPPAIAAHVNGGASQPSPRQAVTSIKGIAKAPAAKPPAQPGIDRPAAKAQPKPSAPSTPPPAKRGALEGLAARIYG